MGGNLMYNEMWSSMYLAFLYACMAINHIWGILCNLLVFKFLWSRQAQWTVVSSSTLLEILLYPLRHLYVQSLHKMAFLGQWFTLSNLATTIVFEASMPDQLKLSYIVYPHNNIRVHANCLLLMRLKHRQIKRSHLAHNSV